MKNRRLAVWMGIAVAVWLGWNLCTYFGYPRW